MKFYLWYSILLTTVYSLTPGKLPNGKIKTYKMNKNEPEKDLVYINKHTASIISRNWLENILTYMVETKKENLNLKHLTENPDIHIIQKINKLEQYIQEQKDIYCFSWMPKCHYGNKDVLFIIICLKINGGYTILDLIQSPFWSPEQIESINLKKSLISLDNSINLEKLFESDLRFKLSWSTWNLNYTK